MEQPTRLFDLPYYQLAQYPQQKAFNTKLNGEWESVTIAEYIDRANQVSRALLHLGVGPDDKIAVITKVNRIEWHQLDMGMSQLGAVNVPLYATLSAKDYAYILNHSDAQYCFVSDQELLDKVRSVQHETQLKGIYTFDTDTDGDTWESFMALGSENGNQEQVDTLKTQVKADDLASIIYTSGTTGTPKGVMMSHANLVYTATLCKDILALDGPGKRVLSYLPISHIFERLTTYYYAYMGFEIYFAESIEKLADNLKEVQPHFIPIVPRLLEKVYDKILAKGQELKGLKKKLFFWAVDLAERFEPNQNQGAWYNWQLKKADKLIFSKWRAVFGGQIEFMVSGSAPLQDRLIKAFTAAGLPIMEGYGMTESAGVISINDARGGNLRLKTVGKTVKGVTVSLADDGEILIQGPNVLQGYYKNPKKTAEAIQNGFFHTGDIGEFDDDGFLQITDRKKEIFKTSGGKYIAPAMIENLLKQSGFIEQVVVIGENRRMPAALIQPNHEFIQEWAQKHDYTLESLHTDSRVIERTQEEIDRYNESLGKWEKIKRFELTEDVWSIEAGHLTPTLKPKRKVIKEKYAHLYQKIYGEKL
ncbi:AMP-dependent synthetase/ligase [Sediminicola luteus]|uniref:Long-chain fatty acid--CoA ligase n=1 Tax=Sediminicola luteus TaxID=319238 RepID=A0A2A4G847_9FLAO|nr:long-chain fatty acid--CoA ligase [Sediminicola luteus]PCE64158.1 long-chain fatty acid--CoA ligase [Sediminicola luteus]